MRGHGFINVVNFNNACDVNLTLLNSGGGSRGEIWGFLIPRIFGKSAARRGEGQDSSDPLPVHAAG